MAAGLSPLLGFVIDRKGRNVAWIMFSCVSTLIAHCLLITQSSQTLAYVSIVLMGLGYSTLASSLWPIIAMVVPLNRQGTAYGIRFTTTYNIKFSNKSWIISINFAIYSNSIIYLRRRNTSHSECWFGWYFLRCRSYQ